MKYFTQADSVQTNKALHSIWVCFLGRLCGAKFFSLHKLRYMCTHCPKLCCVMVKFYFSSLHKLDDWIYEEMNGITTVL